MAPQTTLPRTTEVRKKSLTELFAQDAADSRIKPKKEKKSLLSQFTAATTTQQEVYDQKQVVSIRGLVPGLYTLRFVEPDGWAKRDQTLFIGDNGLDKITEGIFEARRVFFREGEMKFIDKEPKDYCAADVGVVSYVTPVGDRWTKIKYLVRL